MCWEGHKFRERKNKPSKKPISEGKVKLTLWAHRIYLTFNIIVWYYVFILVTEIRQI